MEGVVSLVLSEWSNLSHNQPNTDYYTQKMLYMNPVVTTNQDTQKTTRKKSNHNTKESHQTTKEESKRRPEQRKLHDPSICCLQKTHFRPKNTD